MSLKYLGTMIDYPRNSQQTIPESSVKIVGLGGAGSNMLDRVALDGVEGAELLSLNTDVRTLNGTVAGEKIQLGRSLTKGLGTGGDPELGEKAILEAENEIRDSLRDRQIVFVCVGLGGGSGSGAAPVLVRLAREAGAFVVVFATMPFAFEGRRRRTQAEESLNQLAVLANALVTFDNGRMGELVLPKQGVHEAFSAADRMISDSITAVARLVLRPGLINVGLDELISALKTTRSRCLFGSGLGRGENRAQSALKAALNSPLLDRGSLLEDATTVLVHICGGDEMTLYEVELLMQGLTKYIPENAHLLFGAATDKQMKDALSVTIISALPEDRLQAVPFVGEIEADDEPVAEEVAPVIEPEPEPEAEAEAEAEPEAEPEVELADEAIGFIEEEPEGLEDEESEEYEDEKVDEDLGKGSLEEEDIELEADSSDDFADPKLKRKSDKKEPEPLNENELRIVDLGGSKASGNQGELLLEGAPKGRFDGESPNVDKDGEDLDVPPYLRKRGRRR